MIDPLGKMMEEKDLLGKIQNFVSGFVGYYDRERRREADKILRDTISQRYETEWNRISAVQSQLVSAKQLEHLDEIESAAIKLRTFIDRLNGAARGYSGFFDAVRIKKDELQQLYAYDLTLLQNAERIREVVDELEKAVGSDGLPAAILGLLKVAQETSLLYERRHEVILTSAGVEPAK